jgi:transposase
MKTIEINKAETIALQIEDAIKSNPEGRYFHRLHLVLLLAKGKKCSEVAELFCEPLRNVQRWAKELNEHGLDALKDLDHSGRPTRLTSQQIDELKTDIEKGPLQLGFTQGFWDGPLLAHHIQTKYTVSISVRQCQRFFHQIGYSLKRPQPITAGSSAEAREDFKKTPTINIRSDG